MIPSSIQEGIHNGLHILYVDISSEDGKEEIGSLEIKVKPEYRERLQELETIIKKFLKDDRH